jgi:hypothetical protein
VGLIASTATLSHAVSCLLKRLDLGFGAAIVVAARHVPPSAAAQTPCGA